MAGMDIITALIRRRNQTKRLGGAFETHYDKTQAAPPPQISRLAVTVTGMICCYICLSAPNR